MLSGAMRSYMRPIPVARKRVRFPSPVQESSNSESEVVIDDNSSNSSDRSSTVSESTIRTPSRDPSPVYRNERTNRGSHGHYCRTSPRYGGFSPCRSDSFSPGRWSDSENGDSSPKRGRRGKKWSDSNGVEHLHQELSDQYAILYETKALSDITIIVEGKQFSAHKLVLASRSSYFRGMFYGGLKESEAKDVVLQEVSSDNFEIILRYIYTGSIKVDDVRTSQLLALIRLAHMYDLEALQKCLLRQIESIRITFRNFNELFGTAVLLSLGYIKDRCKNYALLHLNNLCESKEFCELSVLQLEELFYPRNWSKSKDKVIANGLIRYIQKNQTSEDQVVELMKKIKLRLVKDAKGEWVVCRDICRIPLEKRRKLDDNDNAQ